MKLSSVDPEVRRIVLYGCAGGLLIALLKVIEYRHFVRAYPFEVYGGLIALIFAALGLYFGSRRSEQGAPTPASALEGSETPAAVNHQRADSLEITSREREILVLIAEGLTNREIGERLFISENTVKTHSSRLFQKLGAGRRTQAVRKARDLGLIP